MFTINKLNNAIAIANQLIPINTAVCDFSGDNCTIYLHPSKYIKARFSEFVNPDTLLPFDSVIALQEFLSTIMYCDCSGGGSGGNDIRTLVQVYDGIPQKDTYLLDYVAIEQTVTATIGGAVAADVVLINDNTAVKINTQYPHDGMQVIIRYNHNNIISNHVPTFI